MAVSDASVVQASARFRDNQGNDCVNVYHFYTGFAAAQTDQDVFDACDDYITSVVTEFDLNLDNDFEPFDLKVDKLEFLGGEWKVTDNIGFGTWGAGISTTGASDPLPPGTAILGKLYTGLGKHTGKKFFGGFTDAILDTNGNALAAATATVLLGLAKLITPFEISVGNVLATVVLDRATGLVRFTVEAAVSDVISYQRRRRPGTGS